ncbi:MAG: carbohydrate kinase family protein [Bacteroidetes bacterium]|nr:MAG: carbohydrate kinase family protein [Bacteroidota bacterium]
MDSSEKNTDVIVIGELNVDIILNDIDQFPAVGKEIIANTMAVALGSSSAICASNLSALGPKVGFIGKVGDDNFSQVILASLKSKNVDISHIIKSKSLNTGATIVLTYGQDRANVTFPGAMNDLGLNDIDLVYLSQARHMHFSSCFIQPGIRNDLTTLFRKAKESGLTTSLDTQWDPEEKWDLPLEKLLPFVDVFLPNIQEFKFLTRSNTIEEGIKKLQYFANNVVIKNGSDGAIAWDGKDIIYQPAFRNDQVVDCIGAGDSFNAGFIMDFINKKPLKECLETGALTGAINTTKAGGTEAFENPDAIRVIAREKFNYTF